jgi:hypothetical protein
MAKPRSGGLGHRFAVHALVLNPKLMLSALASTIMWYGCCWLSLLVMLMLSLAGTAATAAEADVIDTEI